MLFAAYCLNCKIILIMQSKTQSFIESLINVMIGYFVALGSQLIIFPWFDVNLPLEDNILIGLWFTLISIIRSYVVRRWFNAKIKKAIYE